MAAAHSKTGKWAGFGANSLTVGLPHAGAPSLGQLPPCLLAQVEMASDKLRAKGIDVIDLGFDNPIEPVMPAVNEALKNSLAEVKNHRYSTPRGLLPLKQALARHYARHYGVALDPEAETIMMIGSKSAYAHLCLAILDFLVKSRSRQALKSPAGSHSVQTYAPRRAGFLRENQRLSPKARTIPR